MIVGMFALENRTDETIEVWDSLRMVCGRKFYLKDHPQGYEKATSVCFSADNRYVLSAHLDCRLLIWSMIDNVLYKTLLMEAPLSTMTFTPDGGYLLSVFQGRKEINIWNNYIGKITTNQVDEENLHFFTKLRWLETDYRAVLNREQKIKAEGGNQDFLSELD